jgi:hypothetical protein
LAVAAGLWLLWLPQIQKKFTTTTITTMSLEDLSAAAESLETVSALPSATNDVTMESLDPPKESAEEDVENPPSNNKRSKICITAPEDVVEEDLGALEVAPDPESMELATTQQESDGEKSKLSFLHFGQDTPYTIAAALFPQQVSISNKEEVMKLHSIAVTKKLDNDPTKQKDIPKKQKNIWRACAQKIVNHFRQIYDLETDWIRTMASHWVDGFSDQKLNRKVQEQYFNLGSRVVFYCQKCRNNNQLGLVAVGTCVLVEEEDCQIKMVSVFFHDGQCVSKNKSREIYDTNQFSKMDLDLEGTIGNTYDEALMELNKFSAPDPFWDAGLSVEEKTALSKIMPRPVQELSETKQSTGPPGKHIDFGFPTYDYDDRCYELLPSSNYTILPVNHRNAMVRFAYKCCSEFNLTSELAPYLPDLEQLRLQFNEHRRGISDYSFTKNKEAHLFFHEITLLFGGHEHRRYWATSCLDVV